MAAAFITIIEVVEVSQESISVQWMSRSVEVMRMEAGDWGEVRRLSSWRSTARRTGTSSTWRRMTAVFLVVISTMFTASSWSATALSRYIISSTKHEKNYIT